MSEEELEKYLKLVNHFISDDGNLEEIKTYIANVLYDVDEHYKNYKQEIERLKNIINGMEKFFKYAYDNECRPLNDRKVSVWTICLDKLQELKGSDK